MDPKKKLKIVGIRPGEKLHELMCVQMSPRSNNTIEFKKFFIIFSSETDLSHKIEEYKKKLKKLEKKVSDNFGIAQKITLFSCLSTK